MDIDKVYERKIGIVEREIGDKLFFLLWFMTLTQIVLVIWEWIHLIHPLIRLFGLSEDNGIKAIELSTMAYLVIQLAYMGKKEITRWVRKSDTVLNPDEYIRRIRRGDTAILVWGVLYISGVICVAVHIIDHMPAELSRTFIQVTTLYTGAFVSKSAFKGRLKQKTAEAHPVMDTSNGKTLAAGAGTNQGMEQELLDFIKQKGAVNISDCMDRFKLSKTAIYNHLKKLLELGLLKRSGNGRNVTYRAG